MREGALCFPIRGRRVLLAERRDGSHKGLYTPYGGGIEEGECVEVALVRELYEESQLVVSAHDLFRSARIDTYVNKTLKYRLHVYTTWDWQGEPQDSTEMWRAKWFSFHRLPFARMFPGDRIWVPRVLDGERFEADVHLNNEGELRRRIVYRDTPRYHPYKGPDGPVA